MIDKTLKSENNERAVNLKWTGHLCILANALLIIGIAITWGISAHGVLSTSRYVPIIVCDIVAISILAIFYYFDSKDIYLIKQHVPKKYFTLYFSVGFVFTINLVFIIFYTSLIGQIQKLFETDIQINVTFGILFGIAAMISLIAIGIFRYARFKIDLSLIKRRQGEITNNLSTSSQSEATKEEPTSGITDNATKA